VNSVIRDSIDWVPAVANFPALLVHGNIHLRTSYLDLDESDEGTNFNPTGMSPSDTDQDDDYPSRIQGLVYVTGNARVGDSSTRMFLHGALVCGSITVSGNFTVQTIPDLRQNAPPGFRTSPTMQIVRGSWKREEG
jgi:hypothetical protein